jgi:hypothetical protein
MGGFLKVNFAGAGASTPLFHNQELYSIILNNFNDVDIEVVGWYNIPRFDVRGKSTSEN